MNAPDAALHARQAAAAALIARWFHTNPGTVESYTVEADGDTWIASATLRQPLTPEEHALYWQTLEGGQP